MQSSYLAAIFDLDGVLLDSEPLYSKAAEAVLNRYGKSYDFDVKQRVMGRGAQTGARILVDLLNLPLSPEEYLEQRRAVLLDLLARTPAIPGARELVDRLRERGCKLAVATSSERALYEIKIASHPWFECFDVVVCGDDPRLARPKPSGDIYRLAATSLEVPVDRCLAFEDSPAGVAAGLDAQMRVVALREPRLDPAELAGADPIVANYDELDIATLLGGTGSCCS